jgi:hypothetical protein
MIGAAIAPKQSIHTQTKNNMNHLPAYRSALTYTDVTGIAAATAYALYSGARAAGLGNQLVEIEAIATVGA